MRRLWFDPPGVHASYADLAAPGGGRPRLSLRAMLAMADPFVRGSAARLARDGARASLRPAAPGPSLPRDAVERAFLDSLALGLDTGAQPELEEPGLRSGAEFHEAVLRLTHALVLERRDAGAPAGADGVGVERRLTGAAARRAEAFRFSAEEEAQLLAELPLVCSRLAVLSC